MKFAKVILSAALIFCFAFSAGAVNSGIRREEYLLSKPSADGYAHIDFSVPKESVESVFRYGALPKKYDSRSKDLVTSVKDQGEYGTCWAFAAMSVAETSLIKEFSSRTKNNTDLSEAHLSYFNYSDAVDKLKLTSGDGVILKGTNHLDLGGNLYFATFTLAKWFGAANESAAPYKSINRSTKYSPSLAYSKNTAVLENAYWIPMSDRNTVKKLIMQYGSCGVSYYQDDFYLNLSSGGYYQNQSKHANHSVAVVGWDDDFPRSKFNLFMRPKKNGAWLVKSSYGTSYANNGYVWVSYEDPSLLEDDAIFFDFTATNTYSKNYQYDGSSSFGYYVNKNRIDMANVFKAGGDERLCAFSFYTAEPNVTCTYQIYKSVSGTDSPIKGKAVFSSPVDCSQTYAGYHTVKLPKEIQLNSGEKYSVVVTLKKKNAVVQAFCDYTGYLDNARTVYSKATNKKGQSFISSDGKSWRDLYNEGNGENFRIKAFTKSGNVKPKSIKISGAPSSLAIGATKTLSAKISPNNSSNKVKWTSSNTKIATVTSAGKVKAVSCGEVTITCTSKADSKVKKSVKIKIIPQKVTGLKQTAAGEKTYKISWKAVKGASGYKVYKLNQKSGKYSLYKTTSKTALTVKTTKKGTKDKLYVVAYKTAKSGKKTVTYTAVKSAVLTAVTAPTAVKLKSSSVKATKIKLTWNKSPNAAEYVVYMYNSKKKNYVKNKTVKGTTAEITGLKKNTSYKFKVKPMAKSGSFSVFGKASNTVTAKTAKK